MRPRRARREKIIATTPDTRRVAKGRRALGLDESQATGAGAVTVHVVCALDAKLALVCLAVCICCPRLLAPWSIVALRRRANTLCIAQKHNWDDASLSTVLQN
jgi:hypothetical protein